MTTVSEETIRAAQIHDWDNRVPGENWQRVPYTQVARLITGAVEAERAGAAQLTERAIRDLMLEKFGVWINRIADETVAAKLAEVEAAVRADERRRIRELADRTQAVCTGDEGTSHFFSALLTEREGAQS